MENKYKYLVQNAVDIITETDANGNFLFVNNYTLEHLGYSEDELLGKPFLNFVRADFSENLRKFYIELIHLESDIPPVEFPVLKKDNSEIWVSQKVIIQKNSSGVAIGYFGIMRDITALKKIELKEKIRLEKIENYNKSINFLANYNFANTKSFDQTISIILQQSAGATQSDLVSYLRYNNEQLTSQTSYNLGTGEIEFKKLSSEDSYDINSTTLKENAVITIPDLKNNTSGLFTNFNTLYPEFNSMSVVSVFHNNLLLGIICFINKEVNRQWDSEDTNFIRTTINIISLGLELKLRLETQQKLQYKSKVWSVISKCTARLLASTKPIDELFDIFNIIGNATEVDHIYYYENNLETSLINQRIKWEKDGIPLQIKPLQTFTHQNFHEITSQAVSNTPFIGNVKELKQSFLKNILLESEIKSIIIFPLYFNNQFSGFIGFDSCSDDRIWSQDEITVFQVLTNNISSVIQRSVNERLKNESEERFRLLANNIPGTVYLSKFDADWTKIYLNDQIEELTGYQKSDFLDGKIIFSNLIHEEDRERIISLSQKTILEGDKIHLAYRIRTKDNTIKWIEEFADIIKTEDSIEYIEGIYIDITERKKTESAIIDKELAQSANKAKSEFLANMSHEIKTPLNGIIGFTDLLMKSGLTQEQGNYMTTVNQSANTLLGIINDILDFSKIEAGKLELDLQPVLITDLLESIKQVVRFDIERKKLDLKIIVDERIPNSMWIDSVKLKQILLNLVSNATKFTLEGEIIVRLIYKEEAEKSRHRIRFLIIDTGIGILPENQKKIFEPFSQEDNSTTRKYGGTGLGLTITNQLLQLMNSKVKVKSIPKLGSTFYFDLILKESQLSAAENKDLNIINDTIDTSQLTMKILIAEDNAINMLLIKTILKNLFPKADLLESVNGVEAISKFLALEPDLILMDVQMPLLNGLEATQRIRELSPESNVPIIALTAGTLTEERELCIASGMNDFVSKPIVKDTIREVILKWIEISRN